MSDETPTETEAGARASGPPQAELQPPGSSDALEAAARGAGSDTYAADTGPGPGDALEATGTTVSVDLEATGGSAPPSMASSGREVELPATVAQLLAVAARIKPQRAAKPAQGRPASMTRAYRTFTNNTAVEERESAARRQLDADAADAYAAEVDAKAMHQHGTMGVYTRTAPAAVEVSQMMSISTAYDTTSYVDAGDISTAPGPLKIIFDFYAALFPPQKQTGKKAPSYDDIRVANTTLCYGEALHMCKDFHLIPHLMTSGDLTYIWRILLGSHLRPHPEDAAKTAAMMAQGQYEDKDLKPAGGFAGSAGAEPFRNALHFEQFLELLVRIALLVYSRPPVNLQAGPTRRVEALVAFMGLNSMLKARKHISGVGAETQKRMNAHGMGRDAVGHGRDLEGGPQKYWDAERAMVDVRRQRRVKDTAIRQKKEDLWRIEQDRLRAEVGVGPVPVKDGFTMARAERAKGKDFAPGVHVPSLRAAEAARAEAAARALAEKSYADLRRTITRGTMPTTGGGKNAGEDKVEEDPTASAAAVTIVNLRTKFWRVDDDDADAGGASQRSGASGASAPHEAASVVPGGPPRSGVPISVVGGDDDDAAAYGEGEDTFDADAMPLNARTGKARGAGKGHSRRSGSRKVLGTTGKQPSVGRVFGREIVLPTTSGYILRGRDAEFVEETVITRTQSRVIRATVKSNTTAEYDPHLKELLRNFQFETPKANWRSYESACLNMGRISVGRSHRYRLNVVNSGRDTIRMDAAKYGVPCITLEFSGAPIPPGLTSTVLVTALPTAPVEAVGTVVLIARALSGRTETHRVPVYVRAVEADSAASKGADAPPPLTPFAIPRPLAPVEDQEEALELLDIHIAASKTARARDRMLLAANTGLTVDGTGRVVSPRPRSRASTSSAAGVSRLRSISGGIPSRAQSARPGTGGASYVPIAIGGPADQSPRPVTAPSRTRAVGTEGPASARTGHRRAASGGSDAPAAEVPVPLDTLGGTDTTARPSSTRGAAPPAFFFRFKAMAGDEDKPRRSPRYRGRADGRAPRASGGGGLDRDYVSPRSGSEVSDHSTQSNMIAARQARSKAKQREADQPPRPHSAAAAAGGASSHRAARGENRPPYHNGDGTAAAAAASAGKRKARRGDKAKAKDKAAAASAGTTESASVASGAAAAEASADSAVLRSSLGVDATKSSFSHGVSATLDATSASGASGTATGSAASPPGRPRVATSVDLDSSGAPAVANAAELRNSQARRRYPVGPAVTRYEHQNVTSGRSAFLGTTEGSQGKPSVGGGGGAAGASGGGGDGGGGGGGSSSASAVGNTFESGVGLSGSLPEGAALR